MKQYIPIYDSRNRIQTNGKLGVINALNHTFGEVRQHTTEPLYWLSCKVEGKVYAILATSEDFTPDSCLRAIKVP